MKKLLYIAYGSNLNKYQMQYRCPGSVFVSSAELQDHRLSFKGYTGSAVATVEPAPEKSVPVGVWQITSKDEDALDIYEGYPRLYQKKSLTVTVASGETVRAMIYTIDPALMHGVPSKSYYETLLEGYGDCGLDTKFLNEAVAFSSSEYAKEIEMNGYTHCGFGHPRPMSFDYEPDDYMEHDESVYPDEDGVEDEVDEVLEESGFGFMRFR
jgi:AIG2-like family.